MSNRLRQLRETKGLSRRALAELVDSGLTQILKLETGERRLSDHWAQRLAPHLGVEAYEIFMPSTNRIQLRWAPVIGEVSCGSWQEAVETSEEEVPTTARGERVFALRSVGDSMNQLVSEGGFVIVDPDDVDLVDGKSYVVDNGAGETTAKRFKGSPARLVPASDNPSHPSIIVGTQPFRVIGRIVEVMTPV